MTIPDELLERLTVTTDTKGEATLPYLPQAMAPLTVQISGPGIAAHTLALIDSRQKPILKLGRTGRLVGIVRSEAGEPLADIRVAVWVRAPGTIPSGMLDLSPPEMIKFDSQPLLTSAQGSFQTPPSLLDGSTYRVSIRREGFAPFVSDWVTLGGDRTPIPPIRLRSLRTLAGQVQDREGQPLSGARVLLPSGGPSAVTDARGRFDLRNVLPDKTFILVQQPGFRFHGWPVDPATQAGELRLTLVRTSETPDRTMMPLAEPIAPEEARALANRLLEPYLKDGPEQANPSARTAAIRVLEYVRPGPRARAVEARHCPGSAIQQLPSRRSRGKARGNRPVSSGSAHRAAHKSVSAIAGPGKRRQGPSHLKTRSETTVTREGASLGPWYAGNGRKDLSDHSDCPGLVRPRRDREGKIAAAGWPENI